MNLPHNSCPPSAIPANIFRHQPPAGCPTKWRTNWRAATSLGQRRQSLAGLAIMLFLLLRAAHDAQGQGTLTNGWTHTGTIAPIGHSDSWTFSANAGDSIVIRVGEISQTNTFTPRIRLQNPSAVQIASAQNALAAEIAVTATNTGTFTVIVDDAVGTSATGTYRLTLAKSPGTVFVAPGDQGGPMTNGVMHTGTIDVGDLDVWTFSANSADAIVVRLGENVDTSGNFTPWVRLYGPDGKLQDSGFGAVAGEVTITATNSGTFIVVVGDGNGALSGTGSYRLTLAKTGDPVVVSAGDEGGPMTNGVMHTGTVLTGDLDVWTFTANSGDSLVVRMGEITDTNTFTPWIRLYGPNGKQLGSGFGALAGEVTATATNSGTFIVVAGDGNGALSGTGSYRLTLAKTGDPVVVSAGDDGGPMTNGVMHTGTILTGDLDVWTFTAGIGDSVVVRMGEITDTNTFTPWIRLYGPNGKLLDSGFGAVAGEVSATATNSGTFIVVAGDGNGSLSGSGNYRLTLARTGDPVVVTVGDEGGPMTNGVMHTGTILTGDLDVWTFTATSGDSLVVRIGEITDTNAFTPWIRLYGPNGKLLDSGYDALAGEVTATATNSGTFLVVAGDGNAGLSGSGNYRLTLAKTGDPVVVSAGDDGGPMTNGVMHTGTVLTGDLDVWTFTATSGDSLVVRIGEITDTNAFTPWIRLYGPNGKLLSSGYGSLAGEVAATATNSGTFLVVAGDGNATLSGSGGYRLTLAKTGSLVVVSAGDDGGPMTNGLTHTGTVLTGDLDLWTLTANSGDSLVVRIGEITDTNTFTPYVRLYSPSGVLLGASLNSVAAEVSTRATNSGTFLVVVGDGNGILSGSGDYRLTLGKTGSSLEVAPGDEGGPLSPGVNPEGVITAGDLDVYAFTACKGEPISLQLDELMDNGNFSPWLRVYGPDGVLIRSVSGTTTAEVSLTVTNSGTFIAIVSDGNGNLSGTGTYRLTGNGLSNELRLCLPIISGTNVNLGGIGGMAGTNFVLLTQTNVTTPVASWTPIRTNQFDQFGVFSATNVSTSTDPRRFFILRTP